MDTLMSQRQINMECASLYVHPISVRGASISISAPRTPCTTSTLECRWRHGKTASFGSFGSKIMKQDTGRQHHHHTHLETPSYKEMYSSQLTEFAFLCSRLIMSEANSKFRERLWEEKFRRLCRYKEEHGDTKIPLNDEENTKLGWWLKRQRRLIRRGQMRQDRKKKLLSIGVTFQSEDHRACFWNRMYDKLQEYRKEHGDCLVPYS